MAMPRWDPRTLLCLLLTLTGATQATGQERPAGDPADVVEEFMFVLGNIEYVLLHELAHVLIGDLEIPVIGPEENAADYIATGVLINADRFDPVRAQRARAFLMATANGLATSWEVGLTAGREIQFWDSHSLTIQRFYQIICLVYGSNPQTFGALPMRVGMPAERAARCPAEYAKADRSLQWLLENFGRQSGDPPGADVEIVYQRPPTRVSANVLGAIRASEIFENTVRRLHETFTIREPFRIVMRACREPQAVWLPTEREIIICYELVDNYYLLGRERGANDRQSTLVESPN